MRAFRILSTVFIVWFVTVAAMCDAKDSSVSSGGGAIYIIEGDDGASTIVNDTAALEQAAAGAALPPCDGTSPTAKAEGRCI